MDTNWGHDCFVVVPQDASATLPDGAGAPTSDFEHVYAELREKYGDRLLKTDGSAPEHKNCSCPTLPGFGGIAHAEACSWLAWKLTQ
jgi:hypothetical protein